MKALGITSIVLLLFFGIAGGLTVFGLGQPPHPTTEAELVFPDWLLTVLAVVIPSAWAYAAISTNTKE